MSAIFEETLVFGQHNGPEIGLTVFGDEFYARYETPDGYTVVYDVDRGQYCYADVEGGNFVSSGTPCNKPAPYGTRRHMKEHRDVRNDKFRRRLAALRPREASLPSNVSRTSGPNNGLLQGRQVSHGNVRGLTIVVEFEDVRTNITSEQVDAMLNDENYHANGNFCSARRYYQLMSGGKLDYTNRVVGPVRLSHRQSHYINTLLAREALEIAINDFNVDLQAFDSRGEGVVDALSFMYAGRSLYQGDLWPHNSVVQLSTGNMRTHFYTIQSLGRRAIDLGIGTFVHESGHMLCRFPDLYDYGERDGDFEASSGLGRYCLMSSGNHLDGGKTPSPVCVYLRDLVGWCDRQIGINSAGEYDTRQGDYRTAFRYDTDRPHEYFLVENRTQQGLDASLPDSGLAVYHCDTRGSNEFQDGTPENHYQCALIQADGRQDLERDMNGGDAGDLYGADSGRALASDTVPHSREWDGTDSGFVISDVSGPGEVVSFRTGAPPVSATGVVERSVIADLLIPDDDERGIRSPLMIAETGALTRISVDVAISHTYRGDLHVQLVSPSGTAVVLHGGAGGQLDDLHLDLDSNTFEPLRALAGEGISGEWGLEVKDRLLDDVGRLDSWGLRLEYEATERLSREEATPRLAIPDASATGIHSELTFSGVGNVKDLAVEVEIRHTYRGDLQIELVAPSGDRALLRARDGDSRGDVRVTYTDETTPTLGALFQQPGDGSWALHVRDLVGSDTGTLDRWALSIVH